MKKILIVIISILLLSTTIVSAGIIEEIEAIRKKVGVGVMIVVLPDNNCNNIYVVRDKNGAVWAYSASPNSKGNMIVKKANLLEP